MIRAKILSVCAIVVALCLSAGAVAPPATQPAAADAFPLPIIELHGTPAEIGTQHGKQLTEPIKMLHEKYLKVFLGSTTQRFLAIAAAKSFEQKFPAEDLVEVNALAAQVGMNADEAALAQCFLDLTPMTACSTVSLPATAAPDHIARFGRNLDFPALNIADKHTIVFIIRPSDGRFGFASIGWPGMVGVLSGMNEHGLCLANMEVTRKARVPAAMPYTLLYRTVLEKCTSVDEAIALLERTPRQTANNLMLMDADGARAVVELTPAGVKVPRGVETAALISTNHQRGPDDADTAGRCTRYDFLHDTSKKEFGSIGERQVESMLAGASQGNFTLQSMVFEPANRVIYVSAGKNAAKSTFHRLELTPYFAARNRAGSSVP